jgi:hypothetical protein
MPCPFYLTRTSWNVKMLKKTIDSELC